MRSDRRTILLTGASGVLGRALVDELVSDFTLLCLRRRTPIDDPRVVEIPGDLSARRLGLDATTWRDLCRRVDVIVHSAATTSWRARRPEVIAVNVTGTGQMVELADRAGAPLYHLSTAFVSRRSSAENDRDDDDRAGGVAAYLESKHAAEALIRKADIGAVIVRPSIVIGDSRDGRIAAFQGIYRVLAAVYQGLLPVLPAEPDARIDFVPQDVVARAVGRLVREQIRDDVFWLTAGPEALSVDELVLLTLEAAERAGPRPSPPRMVAKEAVHRLLLPLLDDVMPVALRRQFSAFSEFMLLFQSDEAVPSCLGRLGLGDEADHATLRSAFTASVEYWAAQNQTPATSQEAVG